MKSIVVCNPIHRDLMLKAFPAQSEKDSLGYQSFIRDLVGIEVIFDPDVPAEQPTGRVAFPTWPFVEWEQSDIEWAVEAGIAHREMVPVFWRFKGGLRKKLISSSPPVSSR